MVIGLLSFQLLTILDVVDGIVARFRNKFSLNGIYLDYLGHYFCNSLIILTLAIGIYKQTNNLFIFIPAAIGIFSLLFSKALTINPVWYSKLEQREEIIKIVSNDNITLKNQKNNLILLIFDFLRVDHPFNLMFFGLFFGFADVTLWIYSLFLFLEMGRKLFIQFIRINQAEKK